MHRNLQTCFLACLLALLGPAKAEAARKPTSSVSRQGRSFPTITAFSPESMVAGEPSSTLVVTGANFKTGCVLFFNASPIPTSVISDSQLSAILSNSDLASAGIFSVVVSNTDRKMGTATYLVNKADTITTVDSSANPATPGEAITFMASVATRAPSHGTPQGKVSFRDGAQELGTTDLIDGQATFTTASLPEAAHWITAVYVGDADCNGSTNWPPLAQAVGQITTIPSTTVLSVSNRVTVFGQSVSFVAVVSGKNGGSGVPSGTVTFKDGATSLGTRTLDSSGTGVFRISSLPVGIHSINAVYNGSDFFDPSISGVVTQTIKQCGSTIAVSSSANPSVSGQSVTFTATVTASAPGSGTPSGTVVFKDGLTTLGTGTLSSGQATFTTSSLVVGFHGLTASYSGDNSFVASTSATSLLQTVNKASSTTALTSSANPSVAGQPVTFSASVSAVAPASGTPGGTVSFLDGTNLLGNISLVAGQASLTTASLSISQHQITAVYQGSSDFNRSTSAMLAQSVSPGAGGAGAGNSTKGGTAGVASVGGTKRTTRQIRRNSGIVRTSTAITISTQVAAMPTRITGISRKADASMSVRAFGRAGQKYVIEASTDLQNWSAIGTNSADVNGSVEFVDVNAQSYPTRFYRTVER